MLDLSLRITELERRVANIVRIGTITGIDAASARATVAIGKNTTAPLPWLTRRAGADRDWWAPSPGEQVVVFAVGGELVQGVILPALYSADASAPSDSADIHRTVYVDGATVTYDAAAHKLTADLPGDAEIAAAGKIKASAGAEAELTSATLVKIAAPLVQIKATSGGAAAASMTGSFKLVGDFEIDGNITTNGNIDATGTILDGAGNSNHHEH